jgi:DNA-binding protein HU-beta
MYYHEFVAKLAERTGQDKVTADAVIRALFDPADGIIPEELALRREVSIQGFGVFYTREHAAREGRNPQTGAKITIHAHRRPGIRWGQAMKARVFS